jgi:HPt (histidine-containing phosphotransfer) domain-containing protein
MFRHEMPWKWVLRKGGIMNLAELAKKLGLEEEEYKELVELFLDTGLSDLDKLKSALDAADTEQIARAAHSFKGAAGNIGFMDLHDVAKEIVEKARNNSLEGASESIALLLKKMEEVSKLVGG